MWVITSSPQLITIGFQTERLLKLQFTTGYPSLHQGCPERHIFHNASSLGIGLVLDVRKYFTQLIFATEVTVPNGPCLAAMKLLLRPITASSIVTPLRPLLIQRNYATHRDLGRDSTASRRRAVTPFNDTGFVPWSELSTLEKASRATQQSFNFGIVIVGLALTVC